MKKAELRGTSIIAGEYSDKGENSFKAFNPSKGCELPPLFYEASREDVARAASSSSDAFSVYSRVSGKERADFLDRTAENLEKSEEPVISRCMEETGLPETRLKAELGRTVGQIRMFAALVRDGSWVDARIDTRSGDIRSMLVALGSVAVFGASNFPLAFSAAGGDTASALAAGCPVVFKAHPAHPGTCEIVAGAIHDAVKTSGLPEGVFSLLQGREHRTSLDLVTRPEIAAVAFTGSLPAGRALYDAASGRNVPIPVYAEMGSVNPVILLPNALLKRGEKIAEELAVSVNLGTGQFCTNPGLVFLTGKNTLTRFRKSLEKAISSIPPGIMLSKTIRNSYKETIESVSDLDGVDVKWAAAGMGSGKNMIGCGCIITASLKSFLKHPLLREEIFGPVTILIEAESENEIGTALEAAGGQLTVSFHHEGNDLDKYSSLIEKAGRIAGRIVFNGFPTGVEVCHAMHHSGPYPASTSVQATSVGTRGINRFARPVCYQNAPEKQLPEELREGNPLGVLRLVNGEWIS